MAPASAIAKSAVDVERDRGELAIKVLERGRVPPGARRPVDLQARRPPSGPNVGHSSGALLRRAFGVSVTGARDDPGRRSCDDEADAPGPLAPSRSPDQR